MNQCRNVHFSLTVYKKCPQSMQHAFHDMCVSGKGADSPWLRVPAAFRWGCLAWVWSQGCGSTLGGPRGKRTRQDLHSRRSAAAPGPAAGWTQVSPSGGGSVWFSPPANHRRNQILHLMYKNSGHKQSFRDFILDAK